MIFRSFILSFFVIFFSSMAFGKCPIEVQFGSSVNNLKSAFNTPADIIPGEWGLSEVSLEKNDICPNAMFNDLFVTYSFLSNKLVEIKIMAMDAEAFNLINWAKNNYGDPTEQTHKGDFVPQNSFMWEMDNKIVFGEYEISSSEIFQYVKIVSTEHESLFDEFYENMAKGVDPTYQDRVNKFRRAISNKYE